MGAFNEWTRGSFLEAPDRREIAVVAMNLLMGAAILTRSRWLASQGIELSHSLQQFAPLEMNEIASLLSA